MASKENKKKNISKRTVKVGTLQQFKASCNELMVSIGNSAIMFPAVWNYEHEKYQEENVTTLAQALSLSEANKNIILVARNEYKKLILGALRKYTALVANAVHVARETTLDHGDFIKEIGSTFFSIRSGFIKAVTSAFTDDNFEGLAKQELIILAEQLHDPFKTILDWYIDLLGSFEFEYRLKSKNATRSIETYLIGKFKGDNNSGFATEVGFVGATTRDGILELRDRLFSDKNKSGLDPISIKWLLSLISPHQTYRDLDAQLKSKVGDVGKPEKAHRIKASDYLRLYFLEQLVLKINKAQELLLGLQSRLQL